MDKSNIETQRGKEYYYACCPTCKHTLMQAANETDCYIKCGQCGSMIHIIVQDGNILTKKRTTKGIKEKSIYFKNGRCSFLA